MTNRDAETGRELVLDNRKLIILFTLGIALCGCFFVLGFVEGKRQGFQEGTQNVSESSPGESRPAEPESSKSDEQPLDWYKNVNRSEDVAAPALEPEPVQSLPEPKAAAAEVKPAAREEPIAKPATYSVQVGAFRQKKELDAKTKLLEEKGFQCRTEPPQGPDQLHLLKVGIFKTRAEAVAMQLRLKKSGFPSFVKTNKQTD